MDPHEEQQLELEVLESIYPDELTKISETHFTIKILLDTPSERKHRLELEIKYPPEYPNVVPEISLEKGEEEEEEVEIYDEDDDDDENDEERERAKRALNLSEEVELEKPDIEKLKQQIMEEAEVQVGMPSVFALATLLKDEAEILFQHKLEYAQRKYDEELVAAEMEEQKKFHGTKVTRESWNHWYEKFKQEVKKSDKPKNKIPNGKMGGREIFERGLAGNEDDENITEISEGTKHIAVV